ncbi:MAG: molybdopterin-dependent oxidoreductase, partial [Acidilobaceae archaeon]
RYTNAPFLIKPDGRPLVEADVVAGGRTGVYLVFDARTGRLEDHTRAADPHLTYTGRVTLADGREIEVTTAFNLLRERAAKYPPEEAEKITGAPATTIRRIAREFALYRGVADDTWWTVWNGLVDTYAVMAILILNMLVGSYERPGGLCFPLGRRMPAIGSVVTVGGKTYWRPVWADTIPEAHPGLPQELWGNATETRIDLRKYPATTMNFDVILDAIIKDDPYPVRALFTFATDPITRDMDTEKVKEALKKLELFVAFDVVITDSGMYADYILPDTIYMERDFVTSNKWSLHAAIQKQNKAVNPPPGCEARDMLWAFMEIIRRAWPEKARALGWKDEYRDYSRYESEFLPKMEEAILRRTAAAWAADLRVSADELYARMDKELKEKGYIVLARKTYSPAGLAARPTPSRKLEIYALRSFADGIDPLPDYIPPNYTPPRGGNEFYLISGKSPLVSVHGTLMNPMRWLLDRTVWMNPKDAERLGVKDGDEIELEGIDSGRKARVKVTVTDKVVEGTLFTYAQSHGRAIKPPKGMEWIREGLNPNTLIKAIVVGRVGVGATNCSVRVRKVS